MKTSLLFILLSCILLINIGCEKEPISTENTNNHIRFDAPAVGQTSVYASIFIEEREQELYFASGDTLTLSIEEEVADDIFLVKEVLTRGFDLVRPGFLDTLTYLIDFQTPDSLRLENVIETDRQTSSRLFDRTKRTILIKEVTETEVEVTSRTRLIRDLYFPQNISTGYVDNFTLFGNDYERLSLYIDPNDISFDGNALSLIYSQKNGIVVSQIYNPFSGEGHGWELLP